MNVYQWLLRYHFVIGAALITVSSASIANEQRLSVDVNSEYRYDDNYRLSSEDEESVSNISINPSITYSNNTERNDFTARAEADIDRFSNSDYDFDGYLANFDYIQRYEKSELSLGFSSKRLSSQETERDDTGNVERNSAYRLDSVVSASLRYDLSLIHSLLFLVDYQVSEFESEDFADFDNINTILGLQSQLSEKVSTSAQLIFSRFDSDQVQDIQLTPQRVGNDVFVPLPRPADVDTISDTIGLSLGLNKAISNDSRINMSVSYSEINTEQDIDTGELLLSPQPGLVLDFSESRTVDSSSDIVGFNLEYAKTLSSRDSMLLSLDRDTRASGNGSVRESNSIQLNYFMTLSERSNMSFDLRYGERKNIDSDLVTQSNDDFEFYEIGYGYRYIIVENLSTGLGIRYRSQESENNVEANAWTSFLTLRYQPYQTLW